MGCLSTHAHTGLLGIVTYVLLSVSATGPWISPSSQRGHCQQQSSLLTLG